MSDNESTLTIFDIIANQTGLPVVYSHFKTQGGTQARPPYLATIGAGQNNFEADDTYYYQRDLKRLEYYFTTKSTSTEATIEGILLDNGLLYSKSEDVYIEDQGVFVIYYDF